MQRAVDKAGQGDRAARLQRLEQGGDFRCERPVLQVHVAVAVGAGADAGGHSDAPGDGRFALLIQRNGQCIGHILAGLDGELVHRCVLVGRVAAVPEIEGRVARVKLKVFNTHHAVALHQYLRLIAQCQCGGVKAGAAVDEGRCVGAGQRANSGSCGVCRLLDAQLAEEGRGVEWTAGIAQVTHIDLVEMPHLVVAQGVIDVAILPDDLRQVRAVAKNAVDRVGQGLAVDGQAVVGAQYHADGLIFAEGADAAAAGPAALLEDQIQTADQCTVQGCRHAAAATLRAGRCRHAGAAEQGADQRVVVGQVGVVADRLGQGFKQLVIGVAVRVRCKRGAERRGGAGAPTGGQRVAGSVEQGAQSVGCGAELGAQGCQVGATVIGCSEPVCQVLPGQIVDLQGQCQVGERCDVYVAGVGREAVERNAWRAAVDAQGAGQHLCIADLAAPAAVSVGGHGIGKAGAVCADRRDRPADNGCAGCGSAAHGSAGGCATAVTATTTSTAAQAGTQQRCAKQGARQF